MTAHCIPDKANAACDDLDNTSAELKRYWSNTSPSSPSHILQTPKHALIALIGTGAAAGFSWALIHQKPFDGTLAGVCALICVYIYSLQSERCRLKSQLQGGLAGVSVLANDLRDSLAKEGSRATVDGTSELDLTGYARTLGVSIRDGVVHKEGSTLSKILMDALAKEYLRCVAALKCYQNTFGTLPEEPVEEMGPLQGRTHTAELAPSPRIVREPSPRIEEPAPASPARSKTPLNLSLDLSLLGGAPVVLQQSEPSNSDNHEGATSTISTVGPTHNVGSPAHEAPPSSGFGLFGR